MSTAADPGRYMTGVRAAPPGHLPCNACWQVKLFADFNRDSSRIPDNGGYCFTCRACRHRQRAKHQETHGRGWNRGTERERCKRGHPLVDDNIYFTNSSRGYLTRNCLQCTRDRGRLSMRRWRAKNPRRSEWTDRERYIHFILDLATDAWWRLQEVYGRGNSELWVIRYDRWLEVKAWFWEAVENPAIPDLNLEEP